MFNHVRNALVCVNRGNSLRVIPRRERFRARVERS